MILYGKSTEQLAQYRAIVVDLIQLSVNPDGDIRDGSRTTAETVDFLCDLLSAVKSAQDFAKSEAERALEASTPHLAAVS